jgi:hypothetical protein
VDVRTTLTGLREALEAAEVGADGTIAITLDGARLRLRFAELGRAGAEALISDLIDLNAAALDMAYTSD